MNILSPYHDSSYRLLLGGGSTQSTCSKELWLIQETTENSRTCDVFSMPLCNRFQIRCTVPVLAPIVTQTQTVMSSMVYAHLAQLIFQFSCSCVWEEGLSGILFAARDPLFDRIGEKHQNRRPEEKEKP